MSRKRQHRKITFLSNDDRVRRELTRRVAQLAKQMQHQALMLRHATEHPTTNASRVRDCIEDLEAIEKRLSTTLDRIRATIAES